MAGLVWACGRGDHGPCFMRPEARVHVEPCLRHTNTRGAQAALTGRARALIYLGNEERDGTAREEQSIQLCCLLKKT